MNRIRLLLFLFVAMIFASGCSLMAPQYSASLENVQTLKDAGNFTAKVGTFTASPDKGNANPISIRGSSLSSPYQNSYANYLGEAIKQELTLAKKLGPDANVEISGMLTKNDLHIAEFTTGSGEIEARFIVKKNSQVQYDQVKTVQHEWPSSFLGSIAIPRAVQEYPNLVQKLLTELYADSAFLKALK